MDCKMKNIFVVINFDPCKGDYQFIPPSKRTDTPLAAIINSELEDINPRLYFPDFEPGATLRFSRVFAANCKPTIRNQIWWTSKTFEKEAKSGLTNDNVEKQINEVFTLNIGSPPKFDKCVLDERDIYSSFNEDSSYWSSTAKNNGETQNSDEEEDVSAWRFGPAQIWYDRMGVPATTRKFDYGFRLKKQNSRKFDKAKVEKDNDIVNTTSDPKYVGVDDPFLPVNLVHWEDDVIIDSEDAKKKIVVNLAKGKLPKCGWIPTAQTRSYQAFLTAWNKGIFQRMFGQTNSSIKSNVELGSLKTTIDANHSIFPMDNYDLEMTNWEDDIIWDADNMPAIPEPKILTLDYEDDPKMFDMHDETSTNEEKEASRQFYRKDHQFTKKSEMILMQVQQRQRQEEEEQMESTIAQIADKDAFNLSNDDYYYPKSTGLSNTNLLSGSGFSNVIHHSIPAQNIHRLFFPTNLTPQTPIRLRQHHRTPLSKHVVRDLISRWTSIYSLTRHIRLINEERERHKLSEGGGDVFVMREIYDLSGRDGALIFLEYSEEHPPFLNQPGMASKIRNYYKRKATKEADMDLEFGETAFTHNSPYLGNLEPGQCLQTVENNMYRAPIYKHTPRSNDFLLVRTKLGLFLRPCPPMFLVGQECPFYEVPPPNSKQATIFSRDFLLAFIYRLFWESDDLPRRLKMEDIRNAFPHTAESSVRKRLKQCAEFVRGNDQNNYWVLREEFRLPSKEEVLNMVTPEMCCAQWSMLSAEQRLRDAGFGDKYFFTPENEDSSEDEVTMEDEIKCAPWNTTKAYIAAMKGKCLLDQTGIADPTGCGQGFSYVRVSAKPPKEDVPQVPKRVVTGTNADLRKLPLKEAKEICREYGLRDEESLGRWDIIHVIRTLSTQAAKARSDFSGMARFARGNIRLNFADVQEKYKEYCQQIFDLQNQVLSNPDEVSTDDCSTGEDSDNDDMANKLERMVSGSKNKKMIGGRSFSSSATLSEAEKRKLEFEIEERERLDLQRMIRGEVTKGGSAMVSKGAKDAVARSHDDFFKDDNKEGFSIADLNNASEQGSLLQDTVMKKLKIFRTFRGNDGSEWTRVEVISHPQLIEAYVRIRTTKSEDFIKVFAQNDGQFKEERRKEKRRLQDQLRRLRRNEAKAEQQGVEPGLQKKKLKKPEKEKKPPPPPKASLLKMRCSACGGTGHMKTNKYCPLYGQRLKDRDSLSHKTVGEICPSTSHNETDLSGGMVAIEGTRLKISKKWYNQAEKAQKDALRLHIPRHYLDREKKADSDDLLGDGLVNECKPAKKSGSTASVGDFDRDVSMEYDKQGFSNTSSTGAGSGIHSSSSLIVRRRGTIEEADYLVGPHKSVQRRRADPRVSMGTVLHEIFIELKAVGNAEHLMFPVNVKKVPDYYTIIKKPMDLQQIRQNISENKYELRRQFLEDLTQIWVNSHTYNGAEHMITKSAKEILDLATMRLAENEHKLIELEKAINPLLDDDDMVGFSHILKEIIQECKNLPKSAAFHAKVDSKKFPLYNEKVKRPMDLGKIEQNIKDHRYTSVAVFYEDVKQIFINSQIYNGAKSTYTEKAAEIVQMAESLIDKHRGNLAELEVNIQRAITFGGAGSSIVGSVDEEGGGVLQDDLALSNDELSNSEEEAMDHDDHDDEEIDEDGGTLDDFNLYQSQMHTSGQLNADLALSESDDSNDELCCAKRPKLDDLDASL